MMKKIPREYQTRAAVGIDYIYTFGISSFVLVAITVFTLGQLEAAGRDFADDIFQENVDAIGRAIDDALTVYYRNPDATYEVEVTKRTAPDGRNFHVEIHDRIVYLNTTGTTLDQEVEVKSYIRHAVDIPINGTLTQKSLFWYVAYNNYTIWLLDRPLAPDQYGT